MNPLDRITPEMDAKLKALEDALTGLRGVAVALSGGVDSSFLAAVCADVPGLRVIAVTADSCLLPTGELEAAGEVAARLGIQHVVVAHVPLADPVFAANPVDRCFFCKEGVFSLCRDAAREHGIDHLADGTIADDAGDFRPGRLAGLRAGVISPLADAGLSKKEVSALSGRFPGLQGRAIRSGACLASRFPPGTRITAERLAMVRTLEDALESMGFCRVRARYFDGLAKIEISAPDVELILDPVTREAVAQAGRDAGFHTVALDLEPYRTGRMNELAGKIE